MLLCIVTNKIKLSSRKNICLVKYNLPNICIKGLAYIFQQRIFIFCDDCKTKSSRVRRNKSSIIAYIAAGYIIIFFFLQPRAIAQEEFVPPPAKYIATIPFTMLTGGIVIVRAALDNFKDSLNFVLDTGSGGISLDSTTSVELRLVKKMTDKTVRGIAGMKTVEFTYNHSIHLPGLSVENLDFHINDYDILTSAYGIRIDGIIGYSFLRRYIVSIDYDNTKFDVFTPGTFKYPRGGYL